MLITELWRIYFCTVNLLERQEALLEDAKVNDLRGFWFSNKSHFGTFADRLNLPKYFLSFFFGTENRSHKMS